MGPVCVGGERGNRRSGMAGLRAAPGAPLGAFGTRPVLLGGCKTTQSFEVDASRAKTPLGMERQGVRKAGPEKS